MPRPCSSNSASCATTGKDSVLIPNQRDLFDIPDEVVYLNCASQSPLLKSVCRAGEAGVLRKAQPWTSYRETAAAEAEELRGLFGQLIGATEDDVAIVPATSYGVSVAARNLPIAEGQRIVTLEHQFPSNLHAWRVAAADRGAEHVPVDRPEDGNWTRAVLDAIDETTAVTALPPCHWTDGSAIDLEAVGVRCREVGSAFVIDATQATAAMPVDVNRLQPDYLVSSAYKWLLCPYTLGFLYVAPHQQDGRPIEFHEWGVAAKEARGDAPEIDARRHGARRFDMGERNNPINLTMAVTALKQLVAWGPENVTATLKPLTNRVADHAAERGYAVPPADHRVGHFIGVRLPGGPPPDVAERLAAENVHISLRADALRVSPYLFNTADDIDRFFATLDALS